jgi:hypothetical protein
MKNIIFVLSALALVSGCAARGSQMYHDDTAKTFDLTQPTMKTCYDGVLKATPGAQGKVAVKFTWEKSTGKIMGLAVDAAGTTAPAPVQQCVTKALEGVVLNPADARDGQGSWTFEFTVPAAAPAAAAPKT